MAQFNLTINASNVCGGGFTTVGPVALSAGSISQGAVCPIPYIETPLSPLTGKVDVPYSGSFRLGSTTSLGLVSGLPSGITAGATGVPGQVAVSGTPTVSGSFPLTIVGTNSCGGGSTTSTSPPLLVGTLSIAPADSGGGGSGSVRASGASVYEASTGAFSAILSEVYYSGWIFLSNGTVLVTSTGLNPNWYTVTTPNIGSNYWIRATIVENLGNGIFSSLGTFNSWLSLSTNREFKAGLKLLGAGGAEASRSINFKFELSTTSTGSNIVATWWDCWSYLDLISGV